MQECKILKLASLPLHPPFRSYLPLSRDQSRGTFVCTAMAALGGAAAAAATAALSAAARWAPAAVFTVSKTRPRGVVYCLGGRRRRQYLR